MSSVIRAFPGWTATPCASWTVRAVSYTHLDVYKRQVKSTTVTEAPEEGNTVHLALSADLQRVANLSLEENVKANTGAANCEAGAAVALDVKTFGVLALSLIHI